MSGGLHLDSTATRHTEAGVPLWLHRPMQEAHIDRVPVLAQHAEQGACDMKLRFIKIDRERFTQARRSCLEPAPFRRAPRMGVGKEPVGEPSLEGLPECLSLHLSILVFAVKNRKCC